LPGRFPINQESNYVEWKEFFNPKGGIKPPRFHFTINIPPVLEKRQEVQEKIKGE